MLAIDVQLFAEIKKREKACNSQVKKSVKMKRMLCINDNKKLLVIIFSFELIIIIHQVSELEFFLDNHYNIFHKLKFGHCFSLNLILPTIITVKLIQY